MPLFRQIGGARATHGAGVSVIAVSPEPVETTREYLGKAEVTVDQILQYPLERMGIMGTPTVLVVDAHGVVRKEFDGTLSQADQKQLLAMLSAPAGAP
jgi:peroxiredoxin